MLEDKTDHIAQAARSAQMAVEKNLALDSSLTHGEAVERRARINAPWPKKETVH